MTDLLVDTECEVCLKTIVAVSAKNYFDPDIIVVCPDCENEFGDTDVEDEDTYET